MKPRPRIAKFLVATLVGSATASVYAYQPTPGEVIYDFTTNGFVCDPDDWNFFGPITTDFGWEPDVEDGSGAFQAGNWTLGSGWGMGAAIGVGPFLGQPLCGSLPAGTDDADLDLTLGTGISMRLLLTLPPGDFPPATEGQPGVRTQFQLFDSDGTVAVTPGLIPALPYVNRMYPAPTQWQTVVFPFAGLDWTTDDAAVAGAVPGLNLGDIQAVQIIWRPGATSEWSNVLHFDEITLLGETLDPWADHDHDGDVDLEDFKALQDCYGSDLDADHPETVLFDFESGGQGWTAFGAYTTDSGVLATGSSGQGRYHIADFDIGTNAFGIGDISPAIDLSAYTGLKVDVRMVDVPGQAAFSGPREFVLALDIDGTEFATMLTATESYQTFEVAFADLTPPPAPFHLADPNLRIKLLVFASGKTGMVELDYDQIVGVGTVLHACLPLDANYDGAVDDLDVQNFVDCHLGPNVTTGFFAWCY